LQRIELYYYSIKDSGFVLTESDFLSVLDEQERERYSRYVKTSSKLTFAHARYFVKTLLATQLNCNAVEVRFAYGEHGKPKLDSHTATLHFNMSHCDDAIAIAISNQDVGVDVECIDRRGDPWRQPQEFLNARLAKYVDSADEALKPIRFTQLWTALEASTKLHGDGIFNTKDNFDISASIFNAKTPCRLIDHFVQNCGEISNTECVSIAHPEKTVELEIKRIS
jgi:phosphopantetheinyl transferase